MGVRIPHLPSGAPANGAAISPRRRPAAAAATRTAASQEIVRAVAQGVEPPLARPPRLVGHPFESANGGLGIPSHALGDEREHPVIIFKHEHAGGIKHED